MKGIKEKIAGPLLILIIGSVPAGGWNLLHAALENRDDLLLSKQNDERHDLVIKQLERNITQLTKVQVSFEVYMAGRNVHDESLRRELDELKEEVRSAHK